VLEHLFGDLFQAGEIWVAGVVGCPDYGPVGTCLFVPVEQVEYDHVLTFRAVESLPVKVTSA